MVNPNEISDAAVLIQAIIVRSYASRVRSIARRVPVSSVGGFDGVMAWRLLERRGSNCGSTSGRHAAHQVLVKATEHVVHRMPTSAPPDRRGRPPPRSMASDPRSRPP